MMRYINLIPALLLLLFAGCRNEPDYPTPVQLMEIATLVRMDNKGMEFEAQQSESAPVKKLITNQVFTDKVETGRRLLLYYTCSVEDADKPMVPIEVQGARLISWEVVEALPLEEIKALDAPRLSIISQWMTGIYINFQVMLEYSGEARGFGMVADEATLDAEEVDCYLYLTGKEPAENWIGRRGYGSFDCSKILQRPGQKIRVRFL